MVAAQAIVVTICILVTMADAFYIQIGEAMQAAALRAGETALEIQRSRNLERRVKGSLFDLVTDGDVASQRIIMEELVKSYPDVPFVAEEAIELPRGVRMSPVSEEGDILEGTFWTVDPIDGTSNFASGGRDWAVALSFVEEYEPVVAVVHLPGRGETLTAIRGQGLESSSARGVERLRELPSRTLRESLVGAEMGGFIGRDWLEKLLRFTDCSLGLRNVFSTTGNTCDFVHGINGCLLHLNGGWIWDFAPTSLCVIESGGCVCVGDGSPMTFTTLMGTKRPTSAIFSGSEQMQGEILEVLHR